MRSFSAQLFLDLLGAILAVALIVGVLERVGTVAVFVAANLSQSEELEDLFDLDLELHLFEAGDAAPSH